jgi:hypothetical protein
MRQASGMSARRSTAGLALDDPAPIPDHAPVHLTARRLNRATLARQLLLERAALSAADAIGRIVAIQAQEPASPYVALHDRVADFDPASLDRAFLDGEVVKASLMRITLHAVTRRDYPLFHEAMQGPLRAARLNDRRFLRSGLTAADADALLPDVLEHAAVPRSNAAMEAWLDTRVGPTPKPGIWWAMRHYGPFVHAPVRAPWSYGPRPAYQAAPAVDRPPDRVAAVRGLALRYLEGFGPASIADIGQFTMLSRVALREALQPVDARLVHHVGPRGEDLLDVPDGDIPEEAAVAPPRLMAMWDSVLLAYADRSRVIPPAYRPHVIRSNGDALPTLLVDGMVVGVWRPLGDAIEVVAFEPLPDDAWAGLQAEATAMLGLLGPRDPGAYGRYGRWWEALPAAEVRLLGR